MRRNPLHGAEPIVITGPAIEKARYYSVQLIDAYTHKFTYIGCRATGNEGGSFIVAGPGWKGEMPKPPDKPAVRALKPKWRFRSHEEWHGTLLGQPRQTE